MSKHDLQIKEYPVTEDYPATTVAVCLNHDEASAYQRRRTADLETIAEDYGTYICCLDLGCEGEQDCEGNVLRAIGKAYDLGAASVHKFLCLHTIELSNGEHDVCDCQSFGKIKSCTEEQDEQR